MLKILKVIVRLWKVGVFGVCFGMVFEVCCWVLGCCRGVCFENFVI